MRNNWKEYILAPLITIGVTVVAFLTINDTTNLFRDKITGDDQIPIEEDATNFTKEDLEKPKPNLFQDFLDFKKTAQLQILKRKVVSPPVITKEFIIDKSVKITTAGQFKDIYLFVEAAAGQPLRNLNEYESIYFYIDSGVSSGGHILRSRSLPVDNGIFTSVLHKNFVPLIQLPYSETKEPQLLDLRNILNVPGTHFVGGFVSTMSYGELRKITIGYTCETADCSIR